jgi:hypothetical protein
MYDQQAGTNVTIGVLFAGNVGESWADGWLLLFLDGTSYQVGFRQEGNQVAAPLPLRKCAYPVLAKIPTTWHIYSASYNLYPGYQTEYSPNSACQSPNQAIIADHCITDHRSPLTAHVSASLYVPRA